MHNASVNTRYNKAIKITRAATRAKQTKNIKYILEFMETPWTVYWYRFFPKKRSFSKPNKRFIFGHSSVKTN